MNQLVFKQVNTTILLQSLAYIHQALSTWGHHISILFQALRTMLPQELNILVTLEKERIDETSEMTLKQHIMPKKQDQTSQLQLSLVNFQEGDEEHHVPQSQSIDRFFEHPFFTQCHITIKSPSATSIC
ncbi:hypothetical protein O6H91_07G034500 [Diphasiastrum complanatum]|uniref:Uncharacterized protein n=1 Tax=Diphasiastrum complanatum TaxID=34168 RepID=A0ACC2D3Y3_DIPCM|nr:hypothetical protein O6H91_07G034500 [Diphasiastrum complanatum]